MAMAVARLHLRVALALAACSRAEVIRGISYAASPADSDPPASEDFMCNQAAPMWNDTGRGDLVVMRALGANTVRLFGNEPTETHKDFLDAAHALGMKVIPSIGDGPYIRAADSCKKRNYDCAAQVQAAYGQNLEKGFLTRQRTYHPSLSYLIAVDELDRKVGMDNPRDVCKAIATAIDGMLEAEKEAKLRIPMRAPLPNFTATLSWTPCQRCDMHREVPAMGLMWQLREAMLKPQNYGFTPKNDLGRVYQTRFVNSFSTTNVSTHLKAAFLSDYEKEFPTTPVLIAGYHRNSPEADLQKDLEHLLSIARTSKLLLGVSYAQFWRRTDVDGESDLGIFEPGMQELTTMPFFGTDYPVRCIKALEGPQGKSIASQVAAAFGGAPERFDLGHCLTGGRNPSGTFFVGNQTTTTTVTSTTRSTTRTASTTTEGSDNSTDVVPEELEPTTRAPRRRKHSSGAAGIAAHAPPASILLATVAIVSVRIAF